MSSRARTSQSNTPTRRRGREPYSPTTKNVGSARASPFQKDRKEIKEKKSHPKTQSYEERKKIAEKIRQQKIDDYKKLVEKRDQLLEEKNRLLEMLENQQNIHQEVDEIVEEEEAI